MIVFILSLRDEIRVRHHCFLKDYVSGCFEYPFHVFSSMVYSEIMEIHELHPTLVIPRDLKLVRGESITLKQIFWKENGCQNLWKHIKIYLRENVTLV